MLVYGKYEYKINDKVSVQRSISGLKWQRKEF